MVDLVDGSHVRWMKSLLLEPVLTVGRRLPYSFLATVFVAVWGRPCSYLCRLCLLFLEEDAVVRVVGDCTSC